jgi:trans-2-enoyl-CoA reductase
VNYQNYCQNQRIERLTKQIDELIYALSSKGKHAVQTEALFKSKLHQKCYNFEMIVT